MNHFTIVGKVADAPESFESSAGIAYAKLHVLVEKMSKDQEKEEVMFEVLLWREYAKMELVPGDIVAIRGKLQDNNNEKDGKTYYNASLSADFVEVYPS